MESIENLKGKDYSSYSAKEFADFVCSIISSEGEVKREVWVPDRGDGRTGRVDIVLFKKNKEVIGIECDRKTPRKKSRYKLQNFPLNRRYIITRDPFNIIEL